MSYEYCSLSFDSLAAGVQTLRWYCLRKWDPVSSIVIIDVVHFVFVHDLPLAFATHLHVLGQFFFVALTLMPLIFLEVHLHPWVILHLLGSQSFLWVGHQDLRDEVLCFGRHIIPTLIAKIVVAALDLFEKLEVVFRVEGWCPRQQNIRDNANTPIITFHSVWLLLQYLRGNIPWGAAGRARELIAVQRSGKTKVRNFQRGDPLLFVLQEQVLRFYVPVNDAEAVTVRQRINNRRDRLTRFELRKVVILQYLIEELAAQ